MRFSCRPWMGYVIALFAGALTTLTFSPFELWWLGPVAVGLMYLGLHDLTPGQAALRGWCYGIALFATGTSWIYVSIHEYGYTGVPLSVFLTSLFAATLALFYAIPFWFYRRFTGSRLAFLSFAGTWVLIEVLRTYLFTGFPWLLLGSAHVDSPLAPLAPVGGVYLLTLATAMTGTLGVELLRHRWWAGGAIAALWLSPLMFPTQWTIPSEEPVQVSLLQGNLPQLTKWTSEGKRNAASTYARLTRDIADDVDLVVWPETALPMYEYQAEPLLERVDATLPSGTGLLTGIVQRDDSGRYYNAVVGAGEVTDVYRKAHLVPFGEYIPLEKLLRGIIAFFDLPMSDFTAGDSEQDPIRAAGLRIGTAICYEIIFPNLVAQRADDADVLLTVSNDTWFGDSIGPLQHLQMARLRALENGRYVMRATNNGVTAIIDPQGRVIERAAQFKVATLRGEIRAMHGLTPFTRTGSWPTWLLATVLIIPGIRKQDG
ncbi:apolipoprotein N-acyltransferase [Halomonas sp. McH1-25]|uniref:apolipoprotein N-acyltransferase n=1 Tax=unclassified Halomonas TaxID=2609666 RepID=UPI001EF71AEA|nr:MULTISPECIES: apolipoprotein N-acyltransferase [unclassified Halomonas]MCG7601835.1 apolipoprotein N-acyltransferase [Halomonas sp. McH1-25]MCP1343878.1 apolipoprotein N-acyltransferase [Halomonas sp. FL8]MCP1362015.1 apolipoprotein N-acyltransferase [Halomonas sp. BBD45]MCP1366327.1 apolipoprotein N-acyltransferase [Halomonas sp. BBD48]